ncbi:putative HTH-type transcriptional regulator YdfL [Cladorrhinum sp. PSN259]|nr:putative HTH-type transcriptional regulator YdfL [Cladorrhinum sp. PSN259]
MASKLYDALLDSLCCCSGSYESALPEHRNHSELFPLLNEKPPLHHAPEFPITDRSKQIDAQTIHDILKTLTTATSAGSALDSELDSIVNTTSWSENLAKRVLNALLDVLKDANEDKRASWGKALTDAYDNTVAVSTVVFEKLHAYARDHPTEAQVAKYVLLALLSYGVLCALAPRILVLLGFGIEGPIEGSFAAWFMSTYGGYVPKGSLMSFLQRLGMTWGK